MSTLTLQSDTYSFVKVIECPTLMLATVLTQHLSTGVLGIRVKIMLPWDPNNKNGPKRPLPDNVSILEPKEDVPVSEELKAPKPLDVAPLAAQVAA